MFFNSKETLKQLKEAYSKSVKTKSFLDYIYIKNYSASTAEDYLFEDVFNLTIKNLGELLSRSNPEVMFGDDLVSFSVNGQEYGVVDFESLSKLQNQDFVSDLVAVRGKQFEAELTLSISLVEKGQSRLEFEQDMEGFVEQYCAFWNKECEKLLGSKLSENKIYHFFCESNSMESVFDGSNGVGYGNSWDFHPGCHSLISYKGLKFNNWRGAGSLASILSIGLKKPIVYQSVSEDQFNMLNGSPSNKEENRRRYSPQALTMLNLVKESA